MGTKGEQTKQVILDCAKELFAENGFTKVTMKDICEKTGLSRGGLYRHYGSTELILEDLFREMSQDNCRFLYQKMKKGIAATTLLEEEFNILEKEMADQKSSLSLAIYEYAVTKEQTLFEHLNEIGRRKWEALLNYGIARGEFKRVATEPIIDIILYSYQGVRLWSRIITIDRPHIHQMLETIKDMLLVDTNA